MTTTPKHTPTPWHVGLACELRDAQHHILGTTYGGNKNQDAMARVNAAFIVLAVNSHEALVEAAKAVLPTLEQSFLYLRNESLAHQVVNAARQLRAAIAAVEGRTE